MEAQPATAKRDRRTSYYIVTKTQEFKTKKQAEEFLTKEGGLKDGQVLVKGATVEAKKESIFKLG